MEKVYGKSTDGALVYLYSLNNKNGMKAEITNYGGIVVSLYVPDKNGKLDDVVLGFDHLESYISENPYFGAIIGRHANRIENACFELNGKIYDLYKNDGNNNLHGGVKGFDKVLWKVTEVCPNLLKLFYRSVDGEEGYPGNLDVTVTYTLSDDNELIMDYKAISDADTVINLTNHSYFNLSGHASGDILNHMLKINADKFTVNNNECVTTGEIMEVAGTPVDFRQMKSLKPGLLSNDKYIQYVKGYDHNFIINGIANKPEYCAEVYDPKSGRGMEVYTTKPGIQLYTGNNLNGSLVGKSGVQYRKWSSLCLETQFFPNAMKHKHFPSPVLKTGENYHHITIYKFKNAFI